MLNPNPTPAHRAEQIVLAIRSLSYDDAVQSVTSALRAVETETWEAAADYMKSAHLHQTFGDCEAEFRRRSRATGKGEG